VQSSCTHSPNLLFAFATYYITTILDQTLNVDEVLDPHLPLCYKQ
jgi:hypothetical protein